MIDYSQLSSHQLHPLIQHHQLLFASEVTNHYPETIIKSFLEHPSLFNDALQLGSTLSASGAGGSGGHPWRVPNEWRGRPSQSGVGEVMAFLFHWSRVCHRTCRHQVS